MTLREQQNELLKAEIDRFAQRMKDMVDSFEREVKTREDYAQSFALELDRRNKEAKDDQT